MNFAEICQPLNKLSRKNVKFDWSKECENSFQFQILKKASITPPILKYPDFNKQFILTRDASNRRLAILSQNYNDADLPIAFASRGFKKSEFKKATNIKELVAIHWGVDHFKCCLYGTSQFIVKPDHKPLTRLFSVKDSTSKLTRRRLDMEKYNFEIQYVEVKANYADSISRISIGKLNDLYINNSSILAITRAQTRKENARLEKDLMKEPEAEKMPIEKPSAIKVLNNLVA